MVTGLVCIGVPVKSDAAGWDNPAFDRFIVQNHVYYWGTKRFKCYRLF